MTHELDKCRWHEGQFEPDYGPAGDPSSSGDTIAKTVARWLHKYDTPLPYDATYLGLAAGQAYPELKIVERLGIRNTNVTLIDRRFSATSKSRFAKDYPEIKVLETGMFDLLENTQSTYFSIVTALGIEYTLEDPDVIQALISGLPRIMRTGGIAAIYPYTGDIDPSPIWEANRFEPLFHYTTFNGPYSTLIYRLANNNQAST
jgi:hypothetical protein